MKTSVRYFKQPPMHTQAMEYTIWYVTAEGRNQTTCGVINSHQQTNANALRDYILSFQTKFVTMKWYRMEVSTPITRAYGRLEGGHDVLLIERTPEANARAA